MGLRENDTVEMVRKLPPMEYLALIDQTKRVTLPGGMAAKVWGERQGQKLRFATASAGEEFVMREAIGDWKCKSVSAPWASGATLVLESVKPAQIVRLTTKDPVAVTTPEGLRFWLPPQAANLLMVTLPDETAQAQSEVWQPLIASLGTIGLTELNV